MSTFLQYFLKKWWRMNIHSFSNDKLRRELKQANEDYSRHITRIPDHAWQYEPYKSIRINLDKLRHELASRKQKG